MFRTCFLLCMLWWVLGCGPKRVDPSRVVRAEVAPDDPGMSGDAAQGLLRPWQWRRASFPLPKVTMRPDVVWTVSLGGPIVHPLTTDGRQVFAVANGNVFAYSLSGEKRWVARIDADGPVVNGPQGLVVLTTSGSALVLNPETGKRRQVIPGAERARSAPLFIGDQVMWVDTLGVLQPAGENPLRLSASPITDAASDGERLYIASVDREAICATPSGVLWNVEIPGPGLGHPVIGEQLVFFSYGASQGRPGGIVAVDRYTGERRWESVLDFEPGAPPALGAVLVVPGKGRDLVAMDPVHGGVRWRAPGGSTFTASPAIVEDTVYAGSADGRIRRVDLADGGQIWSVDMGESITGDPLVVDGWLILGTVKGSLSGLRSP